MQSSHILKWILESSMWAITAAAFLFIGCGKDSVSPSGETLTLSEWKSGAVGDYEFEQQVNCFCAAPAGRFHRLTVRDGEIVTAVDLRSGQGLNSSQFHFFKTIQELIEFAESIDPDSVARLDVEFDPVLKYPSSIYVDYDERIADEEIGYETRGVTIPESAR